MSEERRRWIAAAIVLAEDPKALVLCPKNADAYLDVWDQPLGDSGQRLAPHLRCPRCGAYNEMLK